MERLDHAIYLKVSSRRGHRKLWQRPGVSGSSLAVFHQGPMSTTRLPKPGPRLQTIVRVPVVAWPSLRWDSVRAGALHAGGEDEHRACDNTRKILGIPRTSAMPASARLTLYAVNVHYKRHVVVYLGDDRIL